jgi:uncharacterized protein
VRHRSAGGRGPREAAEVRVAEALVRQPQRTCVACRAVKGKVSLVRLALRRSGEVIVDSTDREGGRGAYLCPEARCLARGLERGRLAHAFRKPCAVGPSLAGEVRERWQLAR